MDLKRYLSGPVASIILLDNSGPLCISCKIALFVGRNFAHYDTLTI
jgi:hypothetical protein